MSNAGDSSSKVLLCVLALAVAALAVPVNAQERPEERAEARPDGVNRPEVATKRDPASKPDFARYQARPDGSMPLILDWSSRHVIYTAGYTAEQADRMARDPRAYASFLAHGMVRRRHDPVGPIGPRPVLERKTLERDWAVSLGDGFVQDSDPVFPAKYSFDVNAPPSCTNDFVVYPIDATGSTGSSRARVVGTFTDDPTTGQTVSITITSADSNPVALTLTAGTTNEGTTFAVSGTNNTSIDAANLAGAINRNLSGVALDEVAAVTFAGTFTVYALTAGTGITLSTANNLSNFSWGSVTAGKNGAQANLIGLNNLYAGSGSPFCAGYTYPTFTFSYAAGEGPVNTSPVLSLDGQKIAFIENDDVEENYPIGTILHVLTLGTGKEYGSCTNSGTAAPTCATAAVVPGSTPGSNATDYMLPLELAASLTPTFDYYSSPFVDYSNDVLYVGDYLGDLFSVSPVFGGGTPALTGGFPVAVDSLNPLSSPVVDVGNTGNIFVEDAVGVHLYNVTSGGVVEGYITVGYSDTLYDASPDVDSTNGVGYAVSSCNSSSGNSAVVVQFSTAATGIPGVLSTADLSSPGCNGDLSDPTPDNNYFTNGISSRTTGNNGDLLAGFDNESVGASLMQFQFNSGIMGTTPEYTDTDNGGFGSPPPSFSPLTEFYGDDQAYTIGTVTQSGNTVTVTTAANEFVSNQIVVISGVEAGTGGCTSAAANAIGREQTVTVTSPTTFTFTSTVNATIGGANGSCNVTSALATGPTQDYLFFSSTRPEVFTFALPLSGATQTATATNTTSAGYIGTSGIIVDNDSSSGQASSIYFVTNQICGTACAVKLTQAGLN